MPKADVDFHQFYYQTSFILYANYIGNRIRKFKMEIVLPSFDFQCLNFLACFTYDIDIVLGFSLLIKSNTNYYLIIYLITS